MNKYLTPLLFDFNEVIELDTDLMEIFHEISEISEKFPEILSSIESDQNKHGLKKKELRLAVKHYNECKNESSYLISDICEYDVGSELTLKGGRRRLSPELVLYFLVLRGFWGSISDSTAENRIKDSISINAVLNYYGYKAPGSNTIRENINAVCNSTRRLIMKCQAMHIITKGLDDFTEVYIDSTDTSGNTAYPTDVSVLYRILDRIFRSFNLLERKFDFPGISDGWLETRLCKMQRHLSYISMNVGKRGVKGKVKEEFRLFANLADKVIKSFQEEQNRLLSFWEGKDLSPDKAIALDELWFKIDNDISDAMYVLYYAELLVNEKVKLPSREKILSISDYDAAYIQKGQRNAVIGYKPQIARSRNGFISGYLLPKGNAKDSEMLIPTVINVIETTGVKPLLISTDDGYASQEAVFELKENWKTPVVSINGSKGKKITANDWDCSLYADARRMRSAAESGMFTLKFRHSFGRMRRRGILNVEAEQLEKIIAYNLLHMIRKDKILKNAA